MKIRDFDELPIATDGKVLVGASGTICTTDSDLSDIIGDLIVPATSGKVDKSTYAEDKAAIEQDIADIGTALDTKLDTTAFNATVSAIDEDLESLDGDLDSLDDKIDAVSGIVASDYALSADVSTALAGKEDKVFVAEYNVTSYTDIKTAYDAGKQIVCKYQVNFVQLAYAPLSQFIDVTQTFIFINTLSTQTIQIVCKKQEEQTVWEEPVFSHFYDITATSGSQELTNAFAAKQDTLSFGGTDNVITAINTSAVGQTLAAGTDLKIENGIVSVNTDGKAVGKNSFVEGLNTYAGDLCDHVEGMGGIADCGGLNHIEGFQYHSYCSNGPATNFNNTNIVRFPNNYPVRLRNNDIISYDVKLYELVKIFKDRFIVSCEYGGGNGAGIYHYTQSSFYNPELYKIIDVDLDSSTNEILITIDGIINVPETGYGAIQLYGPTTINSITGTGGVLSSGQTLNTFIFNGGLGFPGNCLDNVRLDNTFISIKLSYTKPGETDQTNESKIIEIKNIEFDSSNNRFTFTTEDIEIPDIQGGGYSLTLYVINSTYFGCNHIEGQDNSIRNGCNSHAEGFCNTITSNTSHVEGSFNYAGNTNAHAEGNFTSAEGSYSHTEGYGTSIHTDASYAHAEGYQTKVSGIAAHAEGSATIASGNASHAEGYNTVAVHEYTHAEGYKTTAVYNGAHAEGIETSATEGGHAEGFKTSAYGQNSHTEGQETYAATNGAHAEGDHTSACGFSTHTEGFKTYAAGYETHAEGSFTSAIGNDSHAEGSYTIAGSDCMHAGGKYNATTANALFVIGNGTSDNARSDAFIVSGNGTISATKVATSGISDIEYEIKTNYVPRSAFDVLTAAYADLSATFVAYSGQWLIGTSNN